MSHFVYIVSDDKHKYFTPGYCSDIVRCIAWYNEIPDPINYQKTLHTFIFCEEIKEEEKAVARFHEINLMPRPYREQLIKELNPDMIDLTEQLLNHFYYDKLK